MRGIFVLVVVFASSIVAQAQDSPAPQLGDHIFVPVTSLAEPFITTHVQTTISVGKTINATIPVYDIENDEAVRSAKADLFVAGIGFRFQHAAKEWLAVRLGLGTFGRLGTDTSSLLADGVTGSLGYDLGWQVRLYRAEKFILSGSMALGNQSATFINLLDWAEGLISGEGVPLVRSRNSLRGSGELHAGWGISRRFGLLGTFGMIYGESFDGKGQNDWKKDARLAVSYDLVHDIKIPLGLALTGGHYESDTAGGARQGVWFWSARLAAQGRKDFSIGLDLSTSYFESPRHGSKLQVSQISIDMRYYY